MGLFGNITYAVGILLAGLTVSCGKSLRTDDNSGQSLLQEAGTSLVLCNKAPVPTFSSTEPWHNVINKIITHQTPGHYAIDAIVVSGNPASIQARFAYGLSNKDLEGELVDVLIDDCSGAYEALGTAKSDHKGRIAFDIPSATTLQPGLYAIYLRARGDNSSTTGLLNILPEGAKFAVFDIDGTLTTDDSELMKSITHPGYLPKTRTGATQIVELRAAMGYQILYLTGRPEQLTPRTRRWLNSMGFAPGVLHLSPKISDVIADNAHVGTYKANYLSSMTRAGFALDTAYGNATTDIYAYRSAGIATKETFIAGPHGGENGSVAIGDGYTHHIDVISHGSQQ